MLDRKILHLPHLDLSYLIGGDGSESLLLLHGMADCALVWSSLADHLGSRYRIIAPDLLRDSRKYRPHSQTVSGLVAITATNFPSHDRIPTRRYLA